MEVNPKSILPKLEDETPRIFDFGSSKSHIYLESKGNTAVCGTQYLREYEPNSLPSIEAVEDLPVDSCSLCEDWLRYQLEKR